MEQSLLPADEYWQARLWALHHVVLPPASAEHTDTTDYLALTRENQNPKQGCLNHCHETLKTQETPELLL